jgi:hypothetical protein
MQDSGTASIVGYNKVEQRPEAIPISLCFDVEPDRRCIDPQQRSPWSGFEDLCVSMIRKRKVLERAAGSSAHFCWNLRLDPQVEHTYGSADWVVQRYRHIFDALLAEGDEIGIHTHAWRWGWEERDWIGDYNNALWLEHCVRLSCRVYEECFGKSARVFRFGDRFMSNKIMGLLEELGILCDLTPEPGHRAVRSLDSSELTTGWIPDYRRVPRLPYHPSRWDFRRPARFGRRKIWVLPLSTGHPNGTTLVGTDPVPECLTMVLGFPFPAMQQILEQILLGGGQPHIVAVARTDVTLDPFTRDQFELFLDHLAEHPLREKFRFSTPLETLRVLTQRIEN